MKQIAAELEHQKDMKRISCDCLNFQKLLFLFYALNKSRRSRKWELRLQLTLQDKACTQNFFITKKCYQVKYSSNTVLQTFYPVLFVRVVV